MWFGHESLIKATYGGLSTNSWDLADLTNANKYTMLGGDVRVGGSQS